MPKTRVSFLCSACGAVQPKWLGRCPECGGWNTLERYAESPLDDEDDLPPTAASSAADADSGSDGPEGPGDSDAAATAGGRGRRARGPVPLSEISIELTPRLSTGIAELDRVLGGGLVPGAAILLGGEPGIGKSTLLLQALLSLARRGVRSLYATSEESPQQVKLRSDRLVNEGDPLGCEPSALLLHSDSQLERILEHARRLRPAVLAVDSIQLVARHTLDASPGSVTQLRRCCLDLVAFAKRTNCAVIMVGHVTKEGLLSGPKVIEHMVDAVLSFEGDRHHLHRVVRATKNRFGSTHEVGLFEMTGAGLLQVDDASLVLGDADDPRPGSVLVPALAGTRGVLAEIQALTATGFLGAAKRKVSGIDASRAGMLIASLEKHAGLRLADQDVYVSSAGGLRVTEPAVDLGVALAIAGAHLRRALPARSAVVGEVSLAGDIRPVRQLESRLSAAFRRGVRVLYAPAAHAQSSIAAVASDGLRVIGVRRLSDAIELLLPSRAKS